MHRLIFQIVAYTTFLLCPFFTQANITIIISEYPDYTPDTASIYIAGSFNNWNPKDENYLLTKQPDGSYLIEIPEHYKVFEYKFTRGGWHTAEGNTLGGMRKNRVFYYDPSSKNIVINKIQSWEDLALLSQPRITLLVDVPENTPHDASLFITGDFNEWNPGDDEYKLNRIAKTIYKISMPPGLDTFQYKITRGNWSSVEGRKNGRARPNRAFMQSSNQNEEIKIFVDTWEDLAGNPVGIYTILLLFAAFQGFLLVIAVNGIENNNKDANIYLSILIVISSLALMARVAVYDRGIFQTYPKLLLTPELIVFLYAPLFYRYIQKLIIIQNNGFNYKTWLHYLPFAIHFSLVIPKFLIENQIFINLEVDSEFDTFFGVVGGIGLIYNTVYWLYAKRLVHKVSKSSEESHSFEQNFKYLNTVLYLQLACIVVWFSTYAFSFTGIIFKIDTLEYSEQSIDAVWLIFSTISYFLGYFAMNQPEIFQIQDEENQEEKQKESPINSEELERLKLKLEKVMKDEKAYQNSKLTLNQLAKSIKTSPHTLSRVINEGYNRNFYDFVNSHRIQAFILEVKEEENKDETLLALAYKVGFNSKTSFNRAFKKMKGTTPREFIKSIDK